MSVFQPRGRGVGGRGGADHGRGGGGRGGGDRDRGGGGRGGGDRGRGGGGRGGARGGFQAGPAEVFGDGKFPPPNQNVTKTEDSYMAQKPTLAGSMAGMSVTADFPARPAYGTRGKPVVLWANYFELAAAKNLIIYRYHVAVSPEAKGRKLKRVFELLLEDPRLKNSATDFKAILVSRKKLPDVELEVAYRSEFEDDAKPDDKPYRVKIQPTGEMDIDALVNHLRSVQPDPNFRADNRMQVIQSLNILLGHYAQSDPLTTTIASNKHFLFGDDKPGNRYLVEHNLGKGLTALRGYFRSARPSTGRILVNVNVSHAVFFKPGPLMELIKIFGAAYGTNLFQLERFLKKVRVETNHLPVKKNKAGKIIPKVKTIIALASKNDGTGLPHPPRVGRFGANATEVEFWLESTDKKKPGNGRYISVFDFFKTQYKKQLNDAFPVMNVGTRANPMYMPVDCCVVIPGQSSMKKLDPDQTAEMIRFACRKPHLNAQSITSDGLAVLGFDAKSKSNLGLFGINVNTNMITVPGRILPPPVVKYQGKNTVNPRGGQWNMMGVKFTQGSKLPSWTYVWITRKGRKGLINGEDHISRIMAEFQGMMNASGLGAPPPMKGKEIVIDVGHNGPSNDELIDSMFKMAATGKVGLMVVVLPDTDAAMYNAVKYAGDIKYGIHTVCALASKITKEQRRDQYLANIALKVNSKLRGSNQTLDAQRLGIIAEGKTMVVGIDVTHPSPGSLSSAPSVAAIVASIDSTLSQFPCELSVQEGRKEMVTDLSEMMRSRLQLWRDRNKALPENILVYRDGVSEGQYQVLKDDEIPSLRKAFDGIYTADQRKKGLPKLSVIVVGKRHHTRFYATKQDEADRSGNPNNGTVVDRGVTSMWNWDFFLQAHTCLQGTAKPAHYYVVLDEIFGKGNLKKPHPFANAADTLEDMTHNMCYLFTRATKAVSICPPAYYADLACERARCYLHKEYEPSQLGGSSVSGGAQPSTLESDIKVHDRLKDSMFYI
ncbi:hypothetical protein V501_09952 [Pseudogymnoascus sp. VKM F-4519 (FW-2642)]|nr:hypothetical protein V501_09952 [Pseudogymnoascus sp. VKM F-4519 (FW-2642)]